MPDQTIDPKMDRLTSQLYYLPFIIGRMGINIAEAQTALNADYVNTLTKIMALMKDATASMAKKGNDAESKADLALLQSLLEDIAPSRYQFTEATLDFRADLAESVDVVSSGGLGFGLGGFVVNAGYSKSYGHDYRAAARITATLHAIPADKESRKQLLDRAKALQDDAPKLAATTATEKELWNALDAHLKQKGAESIGPAPGEKSNGAGNNQ